MWLRELELSDFRSYQHAEIAFPPGLTAVRGANGEGKTNLLEAISYLSTLQSFRGAPPEALVRQRTRQAAIRGVVVEHGRESLLEVEVRPGGRGRMLLNRQRVRRARELMGALVVTVFSPDDLIICKGGPAERRRFMDEVLVARRPSMEAVRSEVEKVLRQRNALLKQSHGKLTQEIETTLEVWDEKLASAGQELAEARADLVAQLSPLVSSFYGRISAVPAEVSLVYEPEWQNEGLRSALERSRLDDLRRGVTLVGPHRDDLHLGLDGMPARTQASQGEQRSLALALRLAAHECISSARGTLPVLLLDDVFSELDPLRTAALVEALPPGQAILTTAGPLPPGSAPELVLEIRSGAVSVV